FLREARILAGLKHPNIIEVYDFDISEWGTPYYVMEYLEGNTLRDVINKYPEGLPIPLLCNYLEPITRGLSYAHEKGIVHRDLKPENIFIEEIQGREVLKILDFGIAKVQKEDQESGHLTATDTVMGTPYYLAPEQLTNKNIGPHTDQYALALIIAEMLSGKAVRREKSIGEILYEVHDPIQLDDPLFNKIPGEIKEAITKASMPEPEERFPDIDSFGRTTLNALNEPTLKSISPTIVLEEPEQKAPIPVKEEEPAQAKIKAKAPLIIGAGLILVILIVFFIVVPFGRKGPPKTFEFDPERIGQQDVINDFITLKQTIASPQDVLSILTFQGDTLVLESRGRIYLMDIKSGDSPTPNPLQEKILMGLPNGSVVYIDEYTITSHDFISRDQRVIVRNPPAGETFKMSESGKYLSVKKGAVLTLFRIDNQKLQEIVSTPIFKGGVGFAMGISNKYLAFTSKGRIYAYLLESGEEILNQPFGEPGAGTIAIQDTADLMAVAGRNNNVYLYHLNDPTKAQITLDKGKCLTLGFFPRFPVLIIAKEGELLFLGLPGGAKALYKDPGLNVSDIVVTTHGLIALDKKAGMITVFSYDKSRLD
ncbi:MAG: protein kinase, partial [Candidatus Aminicenantes bacterium]|nr:protein kinase [Candidatus Aminicenantes bacterium]NIM82681.1 protein kinase [Candidatus Aminicenantes bacterium]NIN22054.1 protein kinase [Candidatus Aminicenantes bacterium]NIN45811.1 protein kinase [Candidatus Aminicenantes bacterium]NIN88649.1 protein kinase [Candidatus Aminicenantes bacterium]